MDNRDNMELDIFGGLKNIVGIKCKACQTMNPSTAKECEECKSPLEAKVDDDVSLSVTHCEGIPGSLGQKKVELEEAKYLLLLRESVEAVKTGKMALDEYQNNVKTVLTVARVGVELFNTELMKERVQQLPEEQQALVERTASLFGDYSLGCSTMLQYDGSSNFAHADRGLEQVTRALTEMDRVQDKALAIDAREKEQKWSAESKSQKQQKQA